MSEDDDMLAGGRQLSDSNSRARFDWIQDVRFVRTIFNQIPELHVVLYFVFYFSSSFYFTMLFIRNSILICNF